MRRGLVALVLIAFAGWFVWKALPFLDAPRAEVYATPTISPTDPSTLVPIKVKRHQRACLDKIPFGPGARYVQVTLLTARPSPPIRVEARGPGYRADATIARGLGSNAVATVPIAPARRETADGTLCFTNEGRHQVAFYGINPGRGSSPSTLTIDDRKRETELSVTLLTSPSKSIGSRLGDIASHIAAFRPVTGWEVFLLGLLAVIGVPVALAFALARSLAADDAVAETRPVASVEQMQRRDDAIADDDAAQASARR